MGSVVELYEALASAPDERARARLIAAAFEHFRVEITAAIQRDRNILLMWIITLMIAQVGVFAALVRLL